MVYGITYVDIMISETSF